MLISLIYNNFIMFCGHRRYPKTLDQRGFALLLALLFTALFGGILTAILVFNRTHVRIAEAQVAGWEAVEIGKAARLYVRDRFAANPALRATTATPSLITINTLKAGGYLSQNFGRLVGGNYVNALNQQIYVIMTNWSATGLGGAVTDPGTVPTAFVYFRNGGKSSFDLVINVVENMRTLGATITAPLFDSTGTNRSANCRTGGPAVGLWDTGCMTQGEFATMAGAVGLPTTFTGGALITPVWKVVQFDLRAVSRFPQPENPGYATMLTDLEMGTPLVQNCPTTANQVSITTIDAAGTPTTTFTGLCKVASDTATADNRFSINNIANLAAERVIAEAQTTDFGGETATIGTANEQVMAISGNARLGSDLRVFDTRSLNGIPYRLSVPNGTLEVERNAYLYAQNTSNKGLATIGTATANALISDSMNSANYNSTLTGTTTGAPRMNITTRERINGTTQVTGTGSAELVTDTLTADSATVHASDNTGQVQVTNRLGLGGATLNVNGNNPVSGYSAILGDITQANNVNVTNNLQFTSVNGSVTAEGTRNTDASGPLPYINVTRCLEGVNVAEACANRQYFVPIIVTP